MVRTTKVGLAVAAHLGADGDAFEAEHRYQPSRWSKPVYSFGNTYYSAGGPTPPQSTQGRSYDFDEPWLKIVSDHDGKTPIWRNGEQNSR